MDFAEAILQYQLVLTGEETCGKESEAHYNIGLCYTWLGELDQAISVFNTVIDSYADDGKAVAFAEFGLAWVDVQRKNFKAAIDRLQQTLDKKICRDPEHCAVMLFQIGRIYLTYLQDYEHANMIFQQVLSNYPNSQIANHPFLDELKKGF